MVAGPEAIHWFLIVQERCARNERRDVVAIMADEIGGEVDAGILRKLLKKEHPELLPKGARRWEQRGRFLSVVLPSVREVKASLTMSEIMKKAEGDP